MHRTINIIDDQDSLNPWVRMSIKLFTETNYLDQISEIYPFGITKPERLDPGVKRKIIMAHNGRETDTLFSLLMKEAKFPYEDPLWYMLRNVKSCIDKNPKQKERLAQSLYSMTADETVIRLESAPKINTQMGPMFGNWLKVKFESLDIDSFLSSKSGDYILDATEPVAIEFVDRHLRQNLKKRPDLVAKHNETYVIGEAKWVGQPGGNQEKQVQEVLHFCKDQRGSVLRVGIVDGFPWALYNTRGTLFENKETVNIQESEYNIFSALLLKDFLSSL